MGFHVIAVDVDDAKFALATRLAAEMVINATFKRVKDGDIEGRFLLRMATEARLP